ncbi:hypothetical protein [Halioxenophilus sp. WMMB6]|uniref:hypothetical protein n=1 Tax=Halioxenophilus sp. WMMB6 TaxID=3073815 RepID=UPI00295EB2B1|nr:hypothetical protein [Halioxenophilus sp. WMMB6]
MSVNTTIMISLFASVIALIGVVFTAVLGYLSQRKQEAFKKSADRQLTLLQGGLDSVREKDVKTLQASLDKIARLEVARSAGYKKIWSISGSLNLFGPTEEPDVRELSTQLKDWYFSHGLLIKKESKDLYFLVQEVLSFAIFKSLSFKRPSPELLFGSDERPVQLLDNLCRDYFGALDENGHFETLASFVGQWKRTINEQPVLEDKNWILLQLLLSRFRSQLLLDLGLAEPEETQ